MNPQHKFMLQQAFQAYESKNFSYAEKMLEKILQSNLRDFDSLHLMAITYAAQEKHEEALKYYRRALEISPRDLSALSNYGSSLSEVGLNQEALEIFQKAIKIDPNDSDINYNVANTLCELENYDEALEFYNRAITINPAYIQAYLNYGRALFDLSRFEEAILFYDKALKLQPNYLECLVNKGEALKELKRYEEALSCEKKALLLEPSFAEVWSNMGNILRELRRYEEALMHCEKAVTLKPDYAKGWFNKGLLFHDLKLFDEAIVFYDKALSLVPNYVEALSNKGVTLHELKRCDEAISCYDKAIKLRPGYHDAVWNKSFSMLSKGEYEEGFELYESRLKSNKVSKDIGRHYESNKTWDGSQSIRGRTLLVRKEQGLGDFIQFCRYIKLVADLGAKVILETPKALASIMTSLEGVSEILLEGDALPFFDYQCSLISLPFLLGTTISSVPAYQKYLAVGQDKVEEWNLVLGKKEKIRIGLVWSSVSGYKDDAKRSILLKDLISALPIEGFEYICLQKELKECDREIFESYGRIKFLGSQIKDFSDTAAIIENLDLVISTCTSVPHLSAAMGKRTWVLLSKVPDWRWLLEGESSPWYSSIKLYRQSIIGEWDSVFRKIRYDLMKLLG